MTISNRSYPLAKSASPTTGVRLQYAETVARYASQFLVSANEEEVLIDFSSGMISDGMLGQPTLPIHSRVALSNASARRLLTMLSQAVNNQDATAAARATNDAVGLGALEAKPPHMEQWTRRHAVPASPKSV